MNVTSKGRYALRVMLDLAQGDRKEFRSLKSVADRQEISLKYLEAIVGNLKRAGLVESSRGKEGGYRLSRAPEDYSVGEILRCIEDNLAPVACLKNDGSGCEKAAACRTLPMWQELDGITNRYLDSVTLGDLISGRRWRE